MDWIWMRGSVCFFAIALIANAVGAAIITPASYTTLNGQGALQGGRYDYLDSTYDGDGDVSVEGAELTNGRGKLTDGEVGLSNWLDSPDAYVGWVTIAPVLTFHFPQSIDLTSVQIHVNNEGTGGVRIFERALVQTSQDGVDFEPLPDYVPTAAEQSNLAAFFVDVPVGRQAKYVEIRLENSGGAWTFLSEVQFQGEVVPEPSGWIMNSLAWLFLIYRFRR